MMRQGWAAHAMRAVIALGVIAAAAPAARADDWIHGNETRAVGGGYEVYFGKRTLRVRKGGRSAPLEVGGGSPSRGSGVAVAVTPAGVTLTYMPTCHDVSATFTHDQLEARLDHAEGLHELRRGDAEAAAALFARAAALDPGLEVAPRNQAVALVRLGRHDEAIAALASALAADPVGMYVRITRGFDPDLAPLADHPVLARVRAATAGSAQIDVTALALPASGFAVASAGWLASVEIETDSADGCHVHTSLVIRDGVSLAALAGMPLAGPADHASDGCGGSRYSRAGQVRIRERVAAANALLAELGFETAAGEPASRIEQRAGGVHKIRFAGSRLGLVIGPDGAARVFRGGKLVVEHPPGTVPDRDDVAAAAVLLGERRILVDTFAHGCEWTEYRRTVAIPIP